MSKQNVAPEDDTPPVAGITPDVVQQLVEKTLEGREAAKSKMDNLLKADSLMKEKFGEKAADVFKQRASTPEKAKILMELAATEALKSGLQRFVKKILKPTGHKISNISYSKLFLKTPPYILGNKEN